MASGDMVMKLLLNTKDFDGKIGKSKKEVEKFGNSAGAIGDAVAGAFGKIGLALFSLDTAKKFFDDFIASSQQNTDEFGRITMQAKAVWSDFVDSFTDSASVGEAFDGILTRAKDLYDALDALANVKISTAFTTNIESSKFKEELVTARNKALPFDERRAALERASLSAQEVYEAGLVNKRAAEDAVKSKLSLESGLPASMISTAIIEEILKIDSRLIGPEEREKILAKKDEFDEKIKYINRMYHDTVSPLYGKLEDNSENRRIFKESAMTEYSGWLLKYAALFKMTDDELQELASTYTTYTQALDRSSEQLSQINELTASIKNEEKSAADAAAKQEAHLREIAALAKTTYGNMRGADQRTPIPGFVTPEALSAEQAAEKIGGIDDKGLMDRTINIPALLKAIDTGKVFEKVQASVDLLSGSFTKLGGSIGGSVGQMLTFIGTVADAAAQIVPLVAQLYAEKAAREAVANAATKEAIGKAISAHAGIPFAGIALGLAAAAAIISTIQSIPKFAEGGIVTSATLGVFGEAGPEAVMPLNRLNDFIMPREMRVRGTIVAQGKNLAVVLDNYGRVRNG